MSALAKEKSSSQKHVVVVLSPLISGEELPSWWGPLFNAACNPSVFLSPAWLESWLEVYGGEFEGVWVRWEDGGMVIGGCLLVTRKSWKWGIPIKTISLNATGESARRIPAAEYNDVLHFAGYEAAIAIDLARVVRTMRWSRLSISGYTKDALVGRLVLHLSAAAKKTTEMKVNFVNFTAFSGNEFESSLVGKSGSQIRRNRRLLESTYGKFEVVRARDIDEAMKFFSELAILHNNRWKKRGQQGSFSSAAIVDFHHRLIARLWPLGAIDLIAIRNSKKLIGYLYNFTTENKVYFFQSGLSYEVGSNRSPGLFAHALCIEDYRIKGYAEYDFLAGEGQYKRTLARMERSMYWTIIYRDSKLPRLLLWARRMKTKLSNPNSSPR